MPIYLWLGSGPRMAARQRLVELAGLARLVWLVAEGWSGEELRLLPHGTTTANAVLERKIVRTVLVTTDGFADVLQIARQDWNPVLDLHRTFVPGHHPGDLPVTAVSRRRGDGSSTLNPVSTTLVTTSAVASSQGRTYQVGQGSLHITEGKGV